MDAKEQLLIQYEDVVSMPDNVQLAYLLNPYLVASCAAKTTTVFANLLFAPVSTMLMEFFQQQPLNPSSHKASEHLTGASPGQLGCCR